MPHGKKAVDVTNEMVSASTLTKSTRYLRVMEEEDGIESRPPKPSHMSVVCSSNKSVNVVVDAFEAGVAAWGTCASSVIAESSVIVAKRKHIVHAFPNVFDIAVEHRCQNRGPT